MFPEAWHSVASVHACTPLGEHLPSFAPNVCVPFHAGWSFELVLPGRRVCALEVVPLPGGLRLQGHRTARMTVGLLSCHALTADN